MRYNPSTYDGRNDWSCGLLSVTEVKVAMDDASRTSHVGPRNDWEDKGPLDRAELIPHA